MWRRKSRKMFILFHLIYSMGQSDYNIGSWHIKHLTLLKFYFKQEKINIYNNIRYSIIHQKNNIKISKLYFHINIILISNSFEMIHLFWQHLLQTFVPYGRSGQMRTFYWNWNLWQFWLLNTNSSKWQMKNGYFSKRI